jgi:glutaredoxin/glutathione-dependent peroxiredoxin
MPIKPGDRIPSVTLKRLGPNGMEPLDIAQYIKGKKVVIFGVPGAFTPTCAQKHLPGYIQKADEIKKAGIDEIICVAVNDPFVMKYWGEVAGVEGKVTMLPDGNGELTRALGLTLDGSGAGLGQRSQRFVMTVNDGVVETLDVEPNPGELSVTGAESCAVNLKRA